MGKVAGICLTSGIYPPESGGPAKFTATFSKWVRDNTDIPVSVVTLTDGASSSKIVDGIRIVKISRSQNLVLRYIKTAIAIRKNSSPKIQILANGLFLETALASLLGGRKYFTKIPGDIVWERARNSGRTSLDIENFQTSKLSFKYKVFRKVFSYSLKRSKKVIAPSTQLHNMALNWGIKSEKVHLIFNSISTSKYNVGPSDFKQYDVLSVCRLVPWKGLDEVIKVCSELGLKLAIAGTGPEMENLKKLAKTSTVSVEFLGEVSRDSLIRTYQNTKLFVLNSSYEGLPHALLEARSCGTFSIANSNTGSAEVISHMKDGLLCGLETGLSLKEALKYAIDNPIFCKEASSLARKNTQLLFELETNYAKILKVLIDD